MEKTLVVIKPDGVERDLVGKIISRFEEKSFEIINIGVISKNMDEFWKLFYIQHIKKDFFNDLLAYVSNGTAIAIILEYDEGNAIQAARELIGPLPPNAPEGTIRGDYAIDFRKNAVHGSDSEESFKWESKVCEQFGIFCKKET